MNEQDQSNGDALLDPALSDSERAWLKMANDCYSASTNYINSEIRHRWSRDNAHFRSEHSYDSKFNTAAYKHRSRTFRPKTRMAARSAEAAASSALFSNDDTLRIRPVNENDPNAAAGAVANKAIIEFRLDNTIPWFLTAMGARQDCFRYGICASMQSWDFEEEAEDIPEVDEDGQFLFDEAGEVQMVQQRTTVLDEPRIDLIPPENVRFDPHADWRDPVKSSWYLIVDMPMQLDDVMDRMGDGERDWRRVHREVLIATIGEKDTDTTKSDRERGRPQRSSDQVLANPVIMVRLCFLRRNGKDMVHYQAGDTALLTEPRPLDEVFPIGERPVVLGRSIIETHINYPESDAGLTSHLQSATNDIANQRADNVSLVLNKRYLTRRGATIDFDALMRNVPGGGITVGDPANDVRVLDTNDVTGSSYQEQDRLDMQIDEMQGVFSGSSVQSNRSVGETVGGMNLLGSAASAISEYSVKVWVETWVEPVMRQLMKWEACCETDETILAIAGEKAKEVMARFDMNRLTDEMLQADMFVRINVGLGATNPQIKIQKMEMGLNAVAGLPNVANRIRADEVIKEVFAALGYQDGDRFFDPEGDQEQEQAPPPDPMVEVKMKELEIKAQELQIKEAEINQRGARDQAELSLKRELALAEMEAKYQMNMDKIGSSERMAAAKMQSERDIKALVETNKQNEMDLKRELGSGI